MEAPPFQNQWRNAGTLESKTWEASLDVQLMRTRAVNWSARVLFDRTRQQITELDVPPFAYGAFGGNSGDVFFARKGEMIGTYYGVHVARSCADLLGKLPCDQFAVNSDGLLVILTPRATADATTTAEKLKAFGHIEGKPVLARPVGRFSRCRRRRRGCPRRRRRRRWR